MCRRFEKPTHPIEAKGPVFDPLCRKALQYQAPCADSDSASQGLPNLTIDDLAAITPPCARSLFCRFDNQIKWLLEIGGQFSPFPGAVRNDEIEQTTLLARLPLFEQPPRILCEFENPYAFVQVGLVCRLVLLN
jgi:hypothetical protein